MKIKLCKRQENISEPGTYYLGWEHGSHPFYIVQNSDRIRLEEKQDGFIRTRKKGGRQEERQEKSRTLL